MINQPAHVEGDILAAIPFKQFRMSLHECSGLKGPIVGDFIGFEA